MPHVKIGYPHKTKTGEKRVQGDIVYVSPQEARDLVDGSKGKIVTPSPEEIVALHAPKADFARGGIIQPRDHGSELPAKPTTKPKAPAKTEKPADG